MKILAVSAHYWPAFKYGGPVFTQHDLFNALVKKGVEVTVYTTNVGLQGRVPTGRQVDLGGIKVTYFSFVNLLECLGGESGWQFSPAMRSAIKANIKDFDMVSINGVWNYPVAVASYYCRKYKKPYTISPIGTLYPETMRKNYWKKLIYLHLISRNDLQRASAVHYTTKDEERCHSELGLKNKSVVIPEGIDLAGFSDLPKGEELGELYQKLRRKKVILFLGRIVWKKGLDILVRAYKRIAEEHPETHLVIVGEGKSRYRNQIIDLIKRCNLANRVVLTGALYGREKLAAYRVSDIFVLPSYSENFGMTVVEAMACGTPVAISNKVGLSQDIEKAGAGVVTECNEDSVYKGINSILVNRDFALKLAEKGKGLVAQNYDIDSVADRTIQAWREIIS